ncbi:MAG: hypothetical protein UT11_C0031G0002 [Berkelbacteria bacterium GW2011_GWA2_38_9]|uniref:Peptidase C39-like domain-containing protein n=1 Tax=Berkelbacteria bacterium GW2011_GWA2_38_9 TaxID=1618334 RepID=A0A0G0NTR6_9BACT|nr:MAG: hypothetical protein UT11_C0031G0002 [Berkelbacteria bacterium GW2011_GWA2_38_9]
MTKEGRKSKKVLKYLVLIVAAIILIGGWFYRANIKDWWWQVRQPELPKAIPAKEDKEDKEDKDQEKSEIFKEISENSDSISSLSSEPQPIEIPSEINLAVPFTSQAPFSKWDSFDEEMCEEASLLMINRFYQNRGFASKDDQENALREIQKWEEVNLPDWKSNNAQEIARVAREMLGYKSAKVIPLTDFKQIKEQIAQNNPVILPAAGRELKNPNFKAPGPLYHMLVVRGWLSDGRIITNDPGTRRGEGYIYDKSVLWDAIHDWNGGNVASGQKVMIVVK